MSDASNEDEEDAEDFGHCDYCQSAHLARAGSLGEFAARFVTSPVGAVADWFKGGAHRLSGVRLGSLLGMP